MTISSSITAQAGRLMLLKVATDTSPTNYQTFAGLRTTDLTINGNPVDISNKASAGWQEMLAGAGVRSVDITGSGIYDAAQTGVAKLCQAAALAGGGILPMEVVTANGDTFTGDWAVATFKRTGPHDNAETFDITLRSHGVVTFTPAV